MLKLKKIYLSLIAGFVLVAAWPPWPTAFLLFIGFVPLLVIYSQLETTKGRHFKFLGWTYLVMLIFNTGSTWWVWNASVSGCIMMLVLNSLIMALPFFAFSLTRSALPRSGYFSLPVYYLATEYIHFNWSASWPWMTLGKGLATFPEFIQWYEFTGEMGGTLLILILNIWIFQLLLKAKYIRLWQPALAVLSVFVVSLLISSLIGSSYRISKPADALECIITQPNIDPYEEKFSDGSNPLDPEAQLAAAIDIAKPLITSSTQLLLMPETAVVGWNNESQINELDIMQPLLHLTDSASYKILTGVETFNTYETKDKPTITARYDSFSALWWDAFNTAVIIQKGKVVNLYHKSKLVPGVEKMPFEFLEKLSINLGGTSGSLGVSEKPINFVVNDKVKIAPLICYESVFGEYACDFVRDGATALAVITNDGWWGNTPGYRQHLLFGAIRCIETRREMVRSANTGVSAHIDARGYITQQTQYDERTAFRCKLQPNHCITFYVRYGNLLGKIALLSALVFILLGLFFSGSKRFKTSVPSV